MRWEQELGPTTSGMGYGRLIQTVMLGRSISIRTLEKNTGICRKRLAKILHGWSATKSEELAIFDELEIDKLRAFLAVDHRDDPDSYFGPELETVANFTTQFASILDEQSTARATSFAPIREQLITPLVIDVTARVMRHQDLVNERSMALLG